MDRRWSEGHRGEVTGMQQGGRWDRKGHVRGEIDYGALCSKGQNDIKYFLYANFETCNNNWRTQPLLMDNFSEGYVLSLLRSGQVLGHSPFTIPQLGR